VDADIRTSCSRYQLQICMFPWCSSRHFVKFFASTSHDGAAQLELLADWALTGSAEAEAAACSGGLEPPNYIRRRLVSMSCSRGNQRDVWERDAARVGRATHQAGDAGANHVSDTASNSDSCGSRGHLSSLRYPPSASPSSSLVEAAWH
jgi:hypothetical protein